MWLAFLTSILVTLHCMQKGKRTTFGGIVVLLLLALLAGGCASSRKARRGGGRIYRAPKCPCAWERPQQRMVGTMSTVSLLETLRS